MEEHFWSVCLEEGSVQAAIWTIKDNAANIINVSNSAPWEDDETIITGTDTCLSYCIQNLSEDAKEPTKAVFGVPSSWVNDGQITRERLDKIRLICNKLSLNPTGFVVLPEAIAHYIKSQEKTPVSAVIIGVYPQSLDVSVFRLGNIAGSVSVSRSTNIADDVIEGLARFGIMDTTPSRFLLFDSKTGDLEETKQNLIKADWDLNNDKVKFLHTPQVEIIDPKEKMIALCLAGASEIAQVGEVKEPEPKKEENVMLEGDNVVEAAMLGFNIGSDSFSEEPSEEVVHGNVGIKSVEALKNFKIKDFFAKRKLTIFTNHMKKIFHQDFVFIAAILIFFISVGIFVSFWFLPKAKVTILIDPKIIKGTQNIVYGKDVPTKTVTTTVSASKTKTTTGTKTIGTPSKGNVTFYNVGWSTTIPAGTILNSSSLRFSLDNDVTIASASGAAGPVSAKGNVTSVGVGGENNLAAQTLFSIANFSSSLIQAKNDTDLSGGSSQEVTAVSKDDVNSLLSDLTAELTNTGKGDLKSQLPSGYLLIDNTVIATPSTSDFDHVAGDQAATVKLTMS